MKKEIFERIYYDLEDITPEFEFVLTELGQTGYYYYNTWKGFRVSEVLYFSEEQKRQFDNKQHYLTKINRSDEEGCWFTNENNRIAHIWLIANSYSKGPGSRKCILLTNRPNCVCGSHWEHDEPTLFMFNKNDKLAKEKLIEYINDTKERLQDEIKRMDFLRNDRLAKDIINK